ncbi:hypothetical protein [Luteipulveratus mongoliensis]|uniref:hypothetical protein n=1 Tax=Luteipulveratus mongoliensis TaxID=571913 RepID=UPI0006960762|nr:hypothetical protein [Luteipulveratus mongoliensis]
MSEPTALDGEAKQRINAALRARAEREVSSSREAVADEHAAADLDQDSSYAVDDLSQSDEAGDLSGLYGGAEEREKGVLKILDALDFGLQTTVVPGAVVAFGGDHYVVGVAADAIEVDGVTYEGISADSPVFEAIKGLSAGDTFTVNGQEHRLDVVA